VKKRILVVEDNSLNRELLCDWLEAEGTKPSRGGSCWRATPASERAADAVLLDVQLGNEDGLSLAIWMRQQPSFLGVPVIA